MIHNGVFPASASRADRCVVAWWAWCNSRGYAPVSAVLSRAELLRLVNVTTETCGAWNDGHDCGLDAGHRGDHWCGGCNDVWNQGPWDDDADEWVHERPDESERCVATLLEQAAPRRTVLGRTVPGA